MAIKKCIYINSTHKKYHILIISAITTHIKLELHFSLQNLGLGYKFSD